MGSHHWETELKKERKLVAELSQEIDVKNKKILEMEYRYKENVATTKKLVFGLIKKINSKDRSLFELEQKYDETSTTMRWLKHKKTKLEEEHKDELQQQAQELEECKAQYALECSRLTDEIKKLKGKLQNEDSTGSENNSRAQINALREELMEQAEAMQDLEMLYQTLIIKESRSNQELQEARRESILGMEKKNLLSDQTTIQIKRMGEVDHKAFHLTCSVKYPSEDCEEISAKLCSTWQEHVRDPHWHPFKKDIINGRLHEIIDDNDEKLKELKKEYGEVMYRAVTNALLELNDYNPSGSYPVRELWNVKEDKRAALKEIIHFLINKFRTRKRKRS
ncbi:factor of DNA methylation 2-like isoform X2 [Tripterygium wilfordii]|uniref:factor of DNA methylation 2-like isoform X2 n=1 Tax=Tripterygium wilfordii TaxID=458696 RepID=UPI0018F81FC6|nr:factor of DNA methylation 2-like isoform X2 [Tripterygium wilfordii]